MTFLKVRQPLSSPVRTILTLCSFLLPVVIWSAVSYIPGIWHPYVLITNSGDTTVAGDYDYLSEGQLVEREVFEKRNATLAKANAKVAEGTLENPIYFPAPHQVVMALYTSFKTEPQRRGDKWLHESLLHSCSIIFWGFIFSAIFGLPLGVLCGTYTPIASLIEPFVDFVRYMPAPVFGALAVSIMGLDDEPKIAIIFIGTFFQMVLVISNTTSKLDRSLLEAAQTLGTTGFKMLTKVVVPGVLPDLYRDMRILIGWAWTYLVVAELIGAKSGISAFLYQAQRYKQFDNVYAAIIMIGIIGLLTDQILSLIGEVLFPYKSGDTPLLSKIFRALKKRWKDVSNARVQA
jgi:NitT/TauT family transport system permease protein